MSKYYTAGCQCGFVGTWGNKSDNYAGVNTLQYFGLIETIADRTPKFQAWKDATARWNS